MTSSICAPRWAIRVAPTLPQDQHILVNLSGRGDKDVATAARWFGLLDEEQADGTPKGDQ